VSSERRFTGVLPRTKAEHIQFWAILLLPALCILVRKSIGPEVIGFLTAYVLIYWDMRMREPNAPRPMTIRKPIALAGLATCALAILAFLLVGSVWGVVIFTLMFAALFFVMQKAKPTPPSAD